MSLKFSKLTCYLPIMRKIMLSKLDPCINKSINMKDAAGNTSHLELRKHTVQWPSTKTTWGRLGKPVTLEEIYALYQSVIVWKRFAYSYRVTRSVGSSTHCKYASNVRNNKNSTDERFLKRIRKEESLNRLIFFKLLYFNSIKFHTQPIIFVSDYKSIPSSWSPKMVWFALNHFQSIGKPQINPSSSYPFH